MSSCQTEKQAKRFIEAAHAAGASEDEAAFDRALKGIASSPPPDTVQERKKKNTKAKKPAK